MQCFAPVHAEVTVAPNLPAATYELKLLDSAQIQSSAQPVKPTAETPPAPAAAETGQPQPTKAKEKTQNNAQINPQEIPKAPEENEESADGFLVQGSVNNAATSQYATNPAFGNTRSGTKALYTGGFAAFESNSALNAQPYALSGVPTAKPAYNDFTGAAALQGPISSSCEPPPRPELFCLLPVDAQQQLAGLARPGAYGRGATRKSGRTDQRAGTGGDGLRAGNEHTVSR